MWEGHESGAQNAAGVRGPFLIDRITGTRNFAVKIRKYRSVQHSSSDTTGNGWDSSTALAIALEFAIGQCPRISVVHYTLTDCCCCDIRFLSTICLQYSNCQNQRTTSRSSAAWLDWQSTFKTFNIWKEQVWNTMLLSCNRSIDCHSSCSNHGRCRQCHCKSKSSTSKMGQDHIQTTDSCPKNSLKVHPRESG